MRRFAFFLVLLSISMFVVGCGEKKPKAGTGTGGTTVEKKEAGGAAPAGGTETKEGAGGAATEPAPEPAGSSG